MPMKHLLLSLACALCVAGCGLAGTAATTATGTAAEAQQAQDAVKLDAARREQAEKDAQ
jgi:hypothetical protein